MTHVPHTSYRRNKCDHKGFGTYSGKSVTQESTTDWWGFVLDNSERFTKPGTELLNDPIRTSCWCVLAARTRSNPEDTMRLPKWQWN